MAPGLLMTNQIMIFFSILFKIRDDVTHQWFTQGWRVLWLRASEALKFLWLKIKMDIIYLWLFMKISSDIRVHKWLSAPVKTLVLILEISEHVFTEIAANGEADTWGLFYIHLIHKLRMNDINTLNWGQNRPRQTEVENILMVAFFE